MNLVIKGKMPEVIQTLQELGNKYGWNTKLNQIKTEPLSGNLTGSNTNNLTATL